MKISAGSVFVEGFVAALFLSASCALSNAGLDRSARETLDLSGSWSFALDRNGVGVDEQWFNKPLQDAIHLPGTLQEQGFGDAPSTNTPWLGML
jgi:hypothetical protein